MFIYSIGIGLYVNKITDDVEQLQVNVRNPNRKIIEKQPEWKTIGES